MRLLGAVAAMLAIGVLASCGPDDGGGEEDAPLGVYLSVPLSGEGATEGRRIATEAKDALAAAGGRAGEHPIELVVVDDTGGGARWSPVAIAANARRASESADTIAYVGELESEAMLTSAPITDLAEIPQVALSDPPQDLDVENLVVPPDPRDGGATIDLVLAAVEAAGDDGGDRDVVLEELRDLAASGSG